MTSHDSSRFHSTYANQPFFDPLYGICLGLVFDTSFKFTFWQFFGLANLKKSRLFFTIPAIFFALPSPIRWPRAKNIYMKQQGRTMNCFKDHHRKQFNSHLNIHYSTESIIVVLRRMQIRNDLPCQPGDWGLRGAMKEGEQPKFVVAISSVG